MSKVQVDTIVDKDDISAPTLSKGAIVTGVCTATTFVGAVTGDVTGNVTGNADTATTATSATTATTATNAQGLTGTPSITVTDVGANDVNATGVGTFGSVVSGAISGSTGTFTGDIDIAENIIHTGDTDTKIHFSSADQISFDTGGTTRVNITSGGNLEMPNDSDYIKIGASGDLQLVHTGGVSYISDSGSPLEIRTDTLKIASGVGTEAFRVGGDGQLGVAGANYGTSGQVLTSGGSAASPSWADAGGGAWEVIQNTDLGSDYGSDTFTYTGFTTAYSEYRVNVNQVGYVGGGAKKLYCRVYLNETLHDAAMAYYSKYSYTDYTTGGLTVGGALETSWWRLQGDMSNNYWQGSITIPQQPDIANFAKSSKIKSEWLSGSYYTPFDIVNLVNVTGGSTLKQITGIRLGNGTDSVNLAFGRIQIYGLKTS